METLLLTRDDISSTLSTVDCIDAVESAFRDLGSGRVEPPQTLGVHSNGGGFHIKAGILEIGGRRFFAAKTNGNFPANPRSHGLPTIQGLLMLCDADDGRVLAVMDSLELTARRTAAATAVAARYLARKNSETLAIIGCGTQGNAHIEAMIAVLPITQIFAYDAQREKAEALASRVRANIPVTVVGSVKEAASRGDAVVTCSTSYEFILRAEDVRAGTFVGGVGVDNEEKKELHPDLVSSAKLVVDLLPQCAKIGDLHHAIDAGAITTEQVHAELGAIVAGKVAPRTSDEETIVFDSTGLAIQDVAAGVVVYERAVKTGHARTLAFSA